MPLHPAKFTISELSPREGEAGDTAATHSGALTRSSQQVIEAADAATAITTAFGGGISVGGTSYAFSSATVGPEQPFQIESSGEQFAIAFEDMAGTTGCDYDYNDRVWLLLVRQVVPNTVVYSGSFPWTSSGGGTATVALTVTQDKTGYEGRYHWNYHLTNNSYNPQPVPTGGTGPAVPVATTVGDSPTSPPPPPPNGMGAFVIRGAEPAGVSDLWSSVGWAGQVGVFGGDPRAVSWQGATGQAQVMIGQSADFSFTTPVCGIADSTGNMYGPQLIQVGGGNAKAPELTIRSVTLWGEPGAPTGLGALGGATTGVSGTILGGNPNAGGGKRIFPEKPIWDSLKTYDAADVRVELSHPVAQAKVVNLYQFDVDDPSSSNPLVDDDLQEIDNRSGNRELSVVGGFTVTVAADQRAGKAFRPVGRKPGDNYRIVATLDPGVTFDTPGGGLSNVDVFRFHYLPEEENPQTPAHVVVYDDGVRAGVYFTGGYGDAVPTANATTVTSPLLTVWRTLHVERDIMDAPPPAEPFAGEGGVVVANTVVGTTEGDDDVAPNGMDGTIPKPGIGLMQAGFRPAYIEVVDDLATKNPNKLIDFIHNMRTPNAQWVQDYNQFVNKMDAANDDKFWAFQLVGAYEETVTQDMDGMGDGITGGTTLGGGLSCLVFTETIRDQWVDHLSTWWAAKPAPLTQSKYIERTAFHEACHLFGFSHGSETVPAAPYSNEGPINANNNSFEPDADNELTPGQLGVIRGRSKPGNR